MVAVHKITNDFYEDSFDLVALHSSLEDYAIAYALNLHLKSSFKRSNEDLDLNGHITVPIFEWKDDINDRYWTLFTNNGLVEDTVSTKGLFKDEPSFTTFHMVPEHREVDYFLKIEQDEFINMDNLVKTLQRIPKIITAYAIETDKLKSKNNLIF